MLNLAAQRKCGSGGVAVMGFAVSALCDRERLLRLLALELEFGLSAFHWLDLPLQLSENTKWRARAMFVLTYDR